MNGAPGLLELAKAAQQGAAEKAAVIEELEAGKTLVSSLKETIEDIESRAEETQRVSEERIASLEAQLQIALNERDEFIEKAQIAVGLQDTEHHGSHGSGSPQNGLGHLVAHRKTPIDRQGSASNASGQMASLYDGQRSVSDMDRKQRELVARQQQLVREQRVADQERLISALNADLGFHQGNPVAAVVVFRSFVHWKAIQQEKGAIFERVSEAIGMQIESFQEDNCRLGY